MSVYVHESRTKGEFLHFISLLDVIHTNNIYCSCLSKMDQPESVILLLSWKSTMTSLEKLIRSERLFWCYRVQNINHRSYREEKHICIFTFPLPWTSHLTKKEYPGSKTIFCLPVDKTAITRPTCMSLWLRMKKSGCRLTSWENNNTPSHQTRGPGSHMSSLVQRPGPLAVVGEYEDDESTSHSASQGLLQSPRPRPCLSCWVALDEFRLPLICLAAFWSHLNLWCLQPPVALSSSVIMHCVKKRT